MTTAWRQRMHRTLLTAILILCSFCAAGESALGETDMETHIKGVMRALSVKPGDPGLCVLTNAGYAMPGGGETLAHADELQTHTGCSLGRGNLLFFHRPSDSPLNTAFFNRSNGRCALLTYDGREPKTSGTVTIGEGSLTDEASWQAVQDALGTDAFSIVSILRGWAAGAPHDFLKCAEFHDHLCGGITSGYFLARFIRSELLKDNAASCVWISCPPWCKDDAIQVLLNLTPGKHSMIVKGLSEEGQSRLPDSSAAGIALIDTGTGDTVEAIVLGYDRKQAQALSGSAGQPGMEGRIVAATGLIPSMGNPELLVRIISRAQITREAAGELKLAGVDPYERLRLAK